MFAALFLRSVPVKGYCHLSLVHQAQPTLTKRKRSSSNWKSCITCLFPCLSFCFTLFQSESHDALSLLSPSISVNVRLSPHLRPRCLYPGSRLFMSTPTGNPLINVTVCSEIKHLVGVLGKGLGRRVK